jgi:hypothetical protein
LVLKKAWFSIQSFDFGTQHISFITALLTHYVLSQQLVDGVILLWINIGVSFRLLLFEWDVKQVFVRFCYILVLLYYNISRRLELRLSMLFVLSLNLIIHFQEAAAAGFLHRQIVFRVRKRLFFHCYCGLGVGIGDRIRDRVRDRVGDMAGDRVEDKIGVKIEVGSGVGIGVAAGVEIGEQWHFMPFFVLSYF